MLIRRAAAADHDAVWGMLEPAVRAGETLAQPRTMDRGAGLAYWFAPGNEVFVADEDRAPIGSYYLRPNQAGAGAHVANCGYVTAAAWAGRGVARAMCVHSLERARERGFRAMQFNLVVTTNDRAVRLWQGMGFRTVGRLPGAFQHPQLGFVDALVMWREL